MSDSVDSTNPGGAAAGEVPPTKHSLRALDAAYNGVTSREQDLAHGPSLLGLGDGQADPRLDLMWKTTEDDVSQETVPSSLPFRLPRPGPTEVMSSSEPSLSGPSYTVPTQSVSQASNSHLDEVLQSLIDQPMVNHSFSWIPEFSWQNYQLCFDGQPLELPATRDGQFSRGDPDPEHEFSISQRSLPRIGGPNRGHDEFQISAIALVDSDERWDENNSPGNLEVASAICSVSSDISLSENAFRGEFIEAGLPAQVEIALQETVNSIVETLVDEYCRSYAPQKRSLAAKRKQADRSSSSSTKSSRASVTRKGAKPGSHKDPREHRHSCIKKLRDIHGLKKHIQEKHFVNHCPKCFMTPPEDTTGIPPHPCTEIYDLSPRPRAGLITMNMQTAIKARPNTRLSQNEKWERLFMIIFPQEPIPSSPYLDHEMALALCEIDKLVCQPCVKGRVLRRIQESQLESQLDSLWRRLDELVLERLVPQILDVFNANVIGMNARIASEEETVDQAQPISTMEVDIPENSHTPDSRGFGYDQEELAAIQPSVLVEVDSTTTPIPELFDDQSEIGVGEDLDHLEAIEISGFPCSDVAGIANFEEIGSDPFSRPGAGDLPWYGGQEMFEAELDQMRGDQTLSRGLSL
ncbi:hypothetical protein FOXG_05071 [Fusarium oxysporum f. sp. lycopersici 4287]|uniref:Uncharacterized protein n=3 Tax=Fusarium oxysporum TaxID=5507 RepID=A0A0J9UUB6_FUSO4|nr:hypothetical protein FOXG_05071 [Fusarium oxysporum f. sp. lycopersici 4287]KNB02011.1 hypothetical protein FOXG_05071 [Fusarium oxysporum f. sp. lycopersici 4287]